MGKDVERTTKLFQSVWSGFARGALVVTTVVSTALAHDPQSNDLCYNCSESWCTSLGGNRDKFHYDTLDLMVCQKTSKRHLDGKDSKKLEI